MGSFPQKWRRGLPFRYWLCIRMRRPFRGRANRIGGSRSAQTTLHSVTERVDRIHGQILEVPDGAPRV
jgi:hypothetical protein